MPFLYKQRMYFVWLKSSNLLFYIIFWCCSVPKHVGPRGVAGSVFGCTVQCMGICCHLGPGLYLQSRFTSEGLTRKVSEVVQSCPTLCDPMDCGLPGSSVHGILQARILEWVAISFTNGVNSSWAYFDHLALYLQFVPCSFFPCLFLSLTSLWLNSFLWFSFISFVTLLSVPVFK